MRSIAGALIITTMLLPVAADRAAAQATAHDSATVTLTIAPYVSVEVDPSGIFEWGQGHLDTGVPNYALNGAAPDFVGGTVDDYWKVASPGIRQGGQNANNRRKYADGAVGRCWLRTRGNVEAKVRVVDMNTELRHTQDPSRELKCEGWIGWDTDGGVYVDKEVWVYDEREDLPPGEHLMWLYATVERKGFSDIAGTYRGVITVEIMAQ